MASRRKATDEEKKLKKKEYDRLRREKIKNDPELLREQQLKEQLKYKMKLEKKQVKRVSDMTFREQRLSRKIWRQKFRKWYRKNKADMVEKTPQPQSTCPITKQQPLSSRMEHIQKTAKRRVRKNRRHALEKIKKLEEDKRKLKRVIERLRKREYRTKQATISSGASPRSAAKKIMKHETKKQIARRILFGETIRDSVDKYYHALNKKGKAGFRKVFLNNAYFLRKYRLLNNMNFLSSRLFTRNVNNITNSGCLRNKLKKITQEVKTDVTKFFEEDENSRMCPGKRDCITKHKIKKQKRYLSGTLLELHSRFCEIMTYKLSYSTFCKLKPFWVVPQKVTARDTCACRICENMDLMVSGLHKASILQTNKKEDILKTICCDSRSLACLQRNCNGCKSHVIAYQPYQEEELSYDQWTMNETEIVAKDKTKRTAKYVVKATINSTAVATVDLFEQKIKHFMDHEAIRLHQFRALKNLKNRLGENEVIIHCDFSENYYMKYGREIQSVHFGGSRQQFSLHTVVIYYKKNGYVEVQCQSFCTLSESTAHGPAAVWAHLKPVFEFIAVNLPKVDTIHFQSDSPATQYRNRTIFYLLAHALEAFITKVKYATWNYSAPGHGKGAVDGIGGSLKRLADSVVACGQDIKDFNSFVRVLQEKTRKIILYVISLEDIAGMTAMIPKCIPPFKGTMKVYQTVYLRSETPGPKVLKMNKLSCFDCLGCNKFIIGNLETKFSTAYTFEVQEETRDGESFRLHPRDHLETVITETDNQPTSQTDMSTVSDAANEFAPTTLQNALPEAGCYVIAQFDDYKHENRTFRYVCYISNVQEGKISALGLRSFENSKRDFVLNVNDQFLLQPSDVLMRLPSPKIKIHARKILRVFPFELEVFEKK